VSIVGLACERLVHSLVCCFRAWLKESPALKQMDSYERGVMKRNEGSNERSGVKDTVAARTKAKELQAV